MTRMQNRKRAQPAIEYLSTYGWALLIIVIAIALIFIFRNSQASAVPGSCSLSTSITCRDMIFGSNSVGSSVVIILSNSQQYPINNPELIIRTQNNGNVTGTCSPPFVLPGGSMVCSASLPNAYGQGSVVSSSIYVKETVCTEGNSAQSCTGPAETVSGSATSHVQPALSSTPFSVSLSVQNKTQPANGQADVMTATVLLLGTPYQGAGISFTESQTFPTINPSMENTNTNGIAVSYISSYTTGNVIVTSSFDGYSATKTIDFVTPASVTFEITNAMGINGNVLTVNGNTYTTSQLPLTLPASLNIRYEYFYANSLTASNGLTASGLVVSGCGVNSATGTISTDYNCTIVGTYTTTTGPIVTLLFQSLSPAEGQSDIGSATTSDSSDGVQIYQCTTSACSSKSNVGSAGTGTSNPATFNTNALSSSGTYYFKACDTTYDSGTDCSNIQTIMIAAAVGPITLICCQDQPYAIAASSNNLYWSNLNNGEIGNVVEYSISSNILATIASSASSTEGIAASGSNVYWTDGYNGYVMEYNGITPTILAAGLSQPYGITVNNGNVYWTDYGGVNSNVMEYNPATNTMTPLAENQIGPLDIAVSGNTVYWTNYGNGNVMEYSDGVTIVIATGQTDAGSIAASGSTVYWTDELPSGYVMEYNTVTNTITTIESEEDEPGGLTISGNNVYWAVYGTGTNGYVMEYNTVTNTITTLASNQGEPEATVVTNGNLYWTDYSSGNIMELT